MKKKLHRRGMTKIKLSGSIHPAKICNDCKGTVNECNRSGCGGTKEVGWRVVK